MNKIFLKEIKKSLKEIMTENKFLIDGKSYIRIINKQILQIVNFQGSSGGDTFTINIGIIPMCSFELLCIPNPQIRIGQLFYEGDKWWRYTTDSMREITDIIKKQSITIIRGIIQL